MLLLVVYISAYADMLVGNSLSTTGRTRSELKLQQGTKCPRRLKFLTCGIVRHWRRLRGVLIESVTAGF